MEKFYQFGTACAHRANVKDEEVVKAPSGKESVPKKLTVAHEPNFASNQRAKHHDLNRASTEDKILMEIQNSTFKARPLNRKILEKA